MRRAYQAGRVTHVGYVVWARGGLHDAAAEAIAGSIRDLVDRGARKVILDITSLRAVGLAAVDVLAATARILADE